MSEEKFTNVTHRIMNFLEVQKLSVLGFESALGTGKGVFAKAIKNGTGFNVKLLLDVGEKFPNLNMDWLLTGRGAMLIGAEVPQAVTVLSGCEEWQHKYYTLLEKYNNCLEDKAALVAKGLVGVYGPKI